MKFMDNASGKGQLLNMLNYEVGFDVRELINSVDKGKYGLIRFVDLDCDGNEIYCYTDMIEMEGVGILKLFFLLEFFKISPFIRNGCVEFSVNDFLRYFCAAGNLLLVRNYASHLFEFFNEARLFLSKLKLDYLPHVVKVHYFPIARKKFSLNAKLTIPKFKEQSEVLGFVLIVENILLEILIKKEIKKIKLKHPKTKKDIYKNINRLSFGEKNIFFKDEGYLDDFHLGVLDKLKNIRNYIAHNLNVKDGFCSDNVLMDLMRLTSSLEEFYRITPSERARFVIAIKFFIEDLMSIFDIESKGVNLGEYVPPKYRSLF